MKCAARATPRRRWVRFQVISSLLWSLLLVGACAFAVARFGWWGAVLGGWAGLGAASAIALAIGAAADRISGRKNDGVEPAPQATKGPPKTS